MFDINGVIWEVYFVPPRHPYLRDSNGRYALAVCDDNDKAIYISTDVTSNKLHKVLAHEITHAAMFSYKVYLTTDQEELIADLIANYGQEIVDITNQVFKLIKREILY